MTKERELLKRALEALSDAKGEIADWGAYADAYFQKKWDYEGSIKQYGPLIEEIRTYLSTPSDDADEAVYQIAMAEGSTRTAWIDVSEDVFNDAGMYGEYKRRALFLHPPKPAEPAARKPMTENEVGEEIWRNADEWSRNFANGFVRGIRFAEKHHGITNES
jgi:hypothetical protein